MSDTRTVSRRKALTAGAALAAALAAIGLPLYFRDHYASTPYDDLFSRLPDRKAATRIGHGVLSGTGSLDPKSVAQRLRAQLQTRTLDAAMADDIAHGRLVEAGGWVLPEGFALLCALAASV